ncbi:MAG: hypothetical protein LAT84_04650 [Balneolia bacterium]|nr:hypothetical protein [Balneolia bacterium]
MEHSTKEKNEYSNWWRKIVAVIAVIFIAIGWMDTITDGENMVIRVMSLAGAVFCIGAIAYFDYRTKGAASLTKMRNSILYSILGVGLVTAIYYLFIYSSPV